MTPLLDIKPLKKSISSTRTLKGKMKERVTPLTTTDTTIDGSGHRYST